MTIVLPFGAFTLCVIVTVVFLGWFFFSPTEDGLAGTGPALIRLLVTSIVLVSMWTFYFITR